MKNYIKLTFLLIATACTKEVDFPTEDTGKIYVNAIISDNGANSITVAVSSPFSSSSPANAEDVTVTMTVDGRLIDLTPDMESSTPEAVIYVPEVSFMAGQELVLSAATEGLQTVNARSVIPDKVSETSITKEVIAAYKKAFPSSKKIPTERQVKMKLKQMYKPKGKDSIRNDLYLKEDEIFKMIKSEFK